MQRSPELGMRGRTDVPGIRRVVACRRGQAVVSRMESETDLVPAAADPRLARVIAGLVGGVLLEDERRHIVVVNQAFCELFGIPAAPEDLVGTDCAGAAEASAGLFADPEGFVARIDEILADRVQVTGEPVVMAAGRRLERDYVPLWIDDEYHGHLWHYRDVSAREFALKQVRRGELRFRALVQSSPIGIYELDGDGRATFVSESGWQILGHPRGRDIGSRWLAAVHPEDLEGLSAAWQATGARGEAFAHEYRVVRHDGSTGNVLSCAVPIRDCDPGTSEPCGYIGTLHDLTQIRRLERSKDLFIASASHELRTPLAAMTMFVELLRQHPADEEQAEQLEVVDRNARRLIRLVDDLLLLARDDLDRVALQVAPLDLVRVAADAVGSAAPAAAAGSVRIRQTGAASVPMRGDVDRLGQVIDNLLSNALKHAPLDTEIVVDVRPADGRAVLEVRDEGPGVPDEDLPRLFDRFFQSGEQRGKEGTGLGLAVVRTIAEAHGGCAHGWAPFGGGLAVTIELPREAAGA